jgi:hypothetical protein
MGKRNIISLLQRLKPSVYVPLLNASFPMEGPLSKIIVEDGSIDTLATEINKAGLKTLVKIPAPPGQSMEVAL